MFKIVVLYDFMIVCILLLLRICLWFGYSYYLRYFALLVLGVDLVVRLFD